MYLLLLSIIAFFFLEIGYFKIADRYNIIDKPNQRSSHTQITLRGGGVIFPIAFVLGIIVFEPHYYLLAIAVLAIATISFLDDVITLNNKLRISVHILSVLLLLSQIFINQNISVASLNLVSYILLLGSIIVIIGVINAYNFMDGINGITVLYSLVTLISCFYIQSYLALELLEEEIFLLLIASLVVFAFFNLRKKAKCFAGDVGSIAVALIISFFIGTLVWLTQDVKWILLLGVYGLDAVATIVCRMLRKENIFDAHRSHFYQFLANDKKWSHVLIAFLYAGCQLLVNAALILLPTLALYVVFSMLVIVYVVLRLILEGKKRLFSTY
ncbi:MAG TPA: glycosyl transferase family 4 [Pelobium sp.]|nr:glycosyl transferase family 4 [Pelobium sp.]